MCDWITALAEEVLLGKRSMTDSESFTQVHKNVPKKQLAMAQA
jgi:hypothetical protein